MRAPGDRYITRHVAQVAAVWAPAAVVAMMISFQAASTARLVIGVTPSPVIAAGFPWWGIWVAVSVVLLVLTSLLHSTLKSRPWVAMTVSALASAALLGAAYVMLVIQPLMSAFTDI